MINDFIEIVDMNDSRIAIDIDSIKGVIEQKDCYYTKENDTTKYKADDHCIIVTSCLGNVRIKETYDEFNDRLENEMFKRNLNI